MNEQMYPDTHWSENIIIADADYIDKVAFDLTVNFERMINRHIPPADFAHWAECVVLDGGLKPGANETTVVLLHRKETTALQNFLPARFRPDLHGQAFQGPLGEFAIQAHPAEDLVGHDDFFLDTVQFVCAQKAVKRIMIVPEADNMALMAQLRNILARVDEDKRITVFSMEPIPGGNFRQELLGYSLMSALGIKADEIKADY